MSIEQCYWSIYLMISLPALIFNLPGFYRLLRTDGLNVANTECASSHAHICYTSIKSSYRSRLGHPRQHPVFAPQSCKPILFTVPEPALAILNTMHHFSVAVVAVLAGTASAVVGNWQQCKYQHSDIVYFNLLSCRWWNELLG